MCAIRSYDRNFQINTYLLTLWQSVQTASDVYLKHICSVDTSACSTLEVINDDCAI